MLHFKNHNNLKHKQNNKHPKYLLSYNIYKTHKHIYISHEINIKKMLAIYKQFGTYKRKIVSSQTYTKQNPF